MKKSSTGQTGTGNKKMDLILFLPPLSSTADVGEVVFNRVSLTF